MRTISRNGTDQDLEAFMLVLRRALLMVVAWIEQRYGLDPRGGRRLLELEDED